jgi:hypothetical protein
VEEPRTEWAAHGTAVHAFLQNVTKALRAGSTLLDARDFALSAVPAEHRLPCEALDLDWLFSELGCGNADYSHLCFFVEAGMAWSVADDRCSLVMEDAEHGDVGGDVTGIADLLIINPKVGAMVLDYKTGRAGTKCQDDPQILTLALMVRGIWGLPVRGAKVYVRDGAAWFDHAEWDDLDIDAHSAEMIEAMEIVAEKDVKALARGDWCRYCPAFNSCPAQTALLRAAAEGTGEVQQFGVALATGDSAKAYRTLREIKTLVQHLEGQIHNYVEARGPIDLGNGMQWGPRQSRREYLNGSIVHEMLRTRYSSDVALAAVEMKSSKTALREALRPVAKAEKLPLAQVERAALTTLREKGGVEVKESVTFKEYPIGTTEVEE